MDFSFAQLTSFRTLTLTLALVLCLYGKVNADYDCVCSQHTQRAVYQSTSDRSQLLGYIYSDDFSTSCLPYVTDPSLASGWLAVAYMHQVAYIRQDYKITRQTCTGPNPDPGVTFAPSKPSTTASTTIRTKHSTTSTTKPVAMTTPIHQTTVTTTTSPSPILTTTAQFTTKQDKTTSTKQPTISAPMTTNKVTKQPTISASMTTHKVTKQPTISAPMTTNKVTKQTTISAPLATHKVTKQPTISAPMTTHKVTKQTTTKKPDMQTAMHIDPCNPGVRRHAGFFNDPITSHNGSCYEIVRHVAYTWSTANQDCKQRGGFLVSISSQDEQKFLDGFLFFHVGPYFDAWIGLNDINTESSFKWVSGEPMSTSFVYPIDNAPARNCGSLQAAGPWVTLPCYLSLHFICEYDQTSLDVLHEFGPPLVG